MIWLLSIPVSLVATVYSFKLYYIAEKIDSRSDYLINMIEKAVDHAGGIENVYRRIA